MLTKPAFTRRFTGANKPDCETRIWYHGKMKRVFWVLFLLMAAGALYFSADFYSKNLKGVRPAIGPVKKNIAKIIEKGTANTTGFPLKLPEGFSISIFAENLAAPRVLAFAPGGTLVTSMPAEGRIVALPDKNGDGTADEAITVISGLNRPHGLAFQCRSLEGEGECEFYIAESNRVSLFSYDAGRMKAAFKKKVADLPDRGNHYTRTLMFGEDGRLLISVGSSCNICNETDPNRAKILSLNLETGELKEFARGLRNSVFMATHPVTGEIWATEMGRDLLGDDTPPDEINILEEGKNYGWPVCYGKNIHDTAFDKNTYIRNPCMEPFETPSFLDIPAHSAPLGLAFFPEEGWPQEYWYNLLVAYHGSWNRSVPTGYKIVRFKLGQQGNPPAGGSGAEDFISGWLNGNSALGRLVDILIQPGGKIYISDDKAGVIYLVRYGAKVANQASEEDKSNLVKVKNIKPGDIAKSPLKIEGEARGYWFFEASFPVKLFDANGKEVAVAIAQAQSEWMTENFVPFRAELKFPNPSTDTGFLVLEKDNPSGLPENADELRILVRFR